MNGDPRTEARREAAEEAIRESEAEIVKMVLVLLRNASAITAIEDDSVIIPARMIYPLILEAKRFENAEADHQGEPLPWPEVRYGGGY